MTMLESQQAATAAGLASPHHDGSDLYVLERPSAPGEDAVLRIRVPPEDQVHAAIVKFPQGRRVAQLVRALP